MSVLIILLIGLAALLLILGVGPFLIAVPPLEDTVPPETLADADSQFIDINGVKVHYKRMGQGEPVMVLLHGFGASTFSWGEVMEPLSAYGTVIAYDRPAFGLTERPVSGNWDGKSPYSTVSQVNLLLGLMDGLGVEKALLVGHSAGGTVALYTALEHPERVNGLVLVDAAAYTDAPFASWMIPIFHSPQMDRLGPWVARQFAARADDLLKRAWHDPSSVTPAIREGYRTFLKVDHWDQGLWQVTRAFQPLDLEDHLGELNLPVLVITGDDDQVVPTQESQRLAEDIPSAELGVVAACGHIPQEEAPQDFLNHVKAWLAAQFQKRT